MEYNPEYCTVTVNGKMIPRWNRATAAADNPRWTVHQAGNGPTYMGYTPPGPGKITVVVPCVSTVNAYLDGLANSMDSFPVSIIDQSDGDRSARCSIARIEKPADLERAGDPTEETWVFVCEDLTFGYQGAADEDTESLPT